MRLQSIRPVFSIPSLSTILYTIVNAVLPPVLLLLVLRELTPIAFGLLALSKWRTIAVKPQYWLANIRANAVDIIVGFSTLLFMHDANEAAASDAAFFFVQVGWAVWYAVWLLVIKPRSSELMVGLQAAAGLVLGLSALFLYSDRVPEFLLVVIAWIVGASSARHFLSSYEESFIGAISFMWGFFVAQLAWLLNRWLIVYELVSVIRIPQITLLVMLAAYSFAEIYHLTKHGRLTSSRKNQIIAFGTIIMVIVVVVSDWSGNV